MGLGTLDRRMNRSRFASAPQKAVSIGDEVPSSAQAKNHAAALLAEV